MKPVFPMVLNGRFNYWHYGDGPFTSSGPTASRWKLSKSGSTPPAVSISHGTTDTSNATPQIYRGVDCMVIDVQSIGAADSNVLIRQNYEFGNSVSSELIGLQALVFGPALGSFQMGLGGKYGVVKTLGQNNGVDIPSKFAMKFAVGSIINGVLPLDIFSKPGLVGQYKIVIVQPDVSVAGAKLPAWRTMDPQLEALAMGRYLQYVPYGLQGQTTATGFFAGVSFNPRMRIAPTLRPKVTINMTVAQLSTGTINTAATPTFSSSLETEHGARFAVTGFTGMAVTQQMIATPQPAFWDADN